jgi:hypothetical protein
VFPAKYKDLDFITIDKLCKINPDFEKFLESVEKYITADARYIPALGKVFSFFWLSHIKKLIVKFEYYFIRNSAEIGR